MSKLKDDMFVCEECLENEIIKSDYIQITGNDTNHIYTCELCRKRTKKVIEVESKTEWNRKMQEEKNYYESRGETDKRHFVFYE